MLVEVIRTNGDREAHEVPTANRRHVANIIDADDVDVVNLRDGRLMVVDRNGNREHNLAASEILRGAIGPYQAWPVRGDVALLLDDGRADPVKTVRLLTHLSRYLDGPEGKALLSAADAIEASGLRFMAVIRTLSSGMHPTKTEPCATCRYVSRVIGEPFGCEAVAQSADPVAAQKATRWEYPTKEAVHGKPHW